VQKRRARQATDDNTKRRMHFACWVTKATDTHSEYKILIALPLQTCLNVKFKCTLPVWLKYYSDTGPG